MRGKTTKAYILRHHVHGNDVDSRESRARVYYTKQEEEKQFKDVYTRKGVRCSVHFSRRTYTQQERPHDEGKKRENKKIK